MELALKRFEEVYFVAEPGDASRHDIAGIWVAFFSRSERYRCRQALFFHALTLHSSRGNFSDERRLAFASCYTREDNIQFKDAYIPCFPCPVLPDDAIIADGKVHLTSEE